MFDLSDSDRLEVRIIVHRFYEGFADTTVDELIREYFVTTARHTPWANEMVRVGLELHRARRAMFSASHWRALAEKRGREGDFEAAGRYYGFSLEAGQP